MDILKKLVSKAKKQKKEQGTKADPKAAGYMNPAGMGESFAQAMDSAQAMSGSKHGFLGVEKKSIDVKEHSHSLLDGDKAELKK